MLNYAGRQRLTEICDELDRLNAELNKGETKGLMVLLSRQGRLYSEASRMVRVSGLTTAQLRRRFLS